MGNQWGKGGASCNKTPTDPNLVLSILYTVIIVIMIISSNVFMTNATLTRPQLNWTHTRVQHPLNSHHRHNSQSSQSSINLQWHVTKPQHTRYKNMKQKFCNCWLWWYCRPTSSVECDFKESDSRKVRKVTWQSLVITDHWTDAKVHICSMS